MAASEGMAASGEPRAGRKGPETHAAVEVLGLSAAAMESESRRIVEAAGEPAFRVRQIHSWVYVRTPESFAGMSDLPKRLREKLAEAWVLHPLSVECLRESRDGTQKLLWDRGDRDRDRDERDPGDRDRDRDERDRDNRSRTHAATAGAATADADTADAHGADPGHAGPESRRKQATIESVVIPDRDRITYCISTQAGCPVKCTFCATGHGGFRGQLRASEIVDQVLSMRRITNKPPTNIVYMGMGEPLLNFVAVERSLEILTEQVGFGARRITVSTVGIPDRIVELARSFPQVKLALSLHAPRGETRSRIIPLNRKYPLQDVLEAVRAHASVTGKKVTFEYIVLEGVNDSERDATDLVRLVEGIPSRINVIGFNPFPGAPYGKPSLKRVLRFKAWIERGFPGSVTVRRSRGEDIHGACGQLSLRAIQPARN